MMNYFSKKKSLYHYINTAEGNYRGYLKEDMVKAKKYFYVLAPILACRWVLEKMTPPPMLFTELADAELPKSLKCEVDRLLDLKMNSPEIKKIPQIAILNEFIESAIVKIKADLNKLEEEETSDWQELNAFFLSVLSE